MDAGVQMSLEEEDAIVEAVAASVYPSWSVMVLVRAVGLLLLLLLFLVVVVEDDGRGKTTPKTDG